MPSLLHSLFCGTNKPNLEKYSTFPLALNFPPTVPPMYPGYNYQRWNALSTEQREKFPPIAPNFVLELIPSDSLSEMQAKMGEYTDAKVRLGWLIFQKTRRNLYIMTTKRSIRVSHQLVWRRYITWFWIYG